MQMERTGFWVLILLLVLLVDPLRDSLWSVLLYADTLALIASLLIVGYFARGS